MLWWTTLYYLKGANTKHNYKGRDGDYLVKNSNIGICLNLTFSTVIRYMIKILGATIIYHWRGHWLPSLVWIVNDHGTLLCRR